MPDKPVTAVIVGAGHRGVGYGSYSLTHPDELQVVGVADPDPVRRRATAEKFNLPEKSLFETAEELAAGPRIADAVINATGDEDHHNSAVAALSAGYDLLLEKPMATTLSESVHIVQEAEETGRMLMICHELRFTPLFQKVKEIFDSGALGQVINISHSENVSYFHMAHSYVRGNWRSLTDSAPMIVAKCCHDLDLLYWFLDEKCTHLSSIGILTHFTAENAPPGAPNRCTDGCPASDSCPYFAPRIYLDSYPIKLAVSRSPKPLLKFIGNTAIHHPRLARTLGRIIPTVRILTEYSGWPRNTITENPESDAAVMESLRNGPYGRCVYHCDNSVVDHQVVSLSYASGVTATLTMHGHSHEEGRTLRVDGSRATLLGKFSYSEAWLDIHPHGLGEVSRFTFPAEVDQDSGHGGGDAGLIKQFVRAMQGDRAPLTSPRDALESHLMGFAAEAARLGPVTVDMDALRENVM